MTFRRKKETELVESAENAEETSAEAPVNVPEEAMENVSSAGKSRQGKKWWIIAAFSVLFVLFTGVSAAAGYFYLQSKKQVPATGTSMVNETEQILGEVSKLMELPSEAPTLATVTDKERLSGQPFFQKAENGDKVILFTEAKRVILYRPSTKKIVDVSALNITDNKTVAPQSQQTETQRSAGAEKPSKAEAALTTVKVALYNGTIKIGVTNGLEDKIVAEFPEAQVTMKEKAAKSDYTGTLVIDLSGKNADLVDKIASAVGGTVATALPDGETNPGTDILVIVGNK